MRAIPLYLLGGLLALPVQASEVQDLLGRLAAAERQQSFQGTFIYERNGSFSTHAVWHRVEEGAKFASAFCSSMGLPRRCSKSMVRLSASLARWLTRSVKGRLGLLASWLSSS